jgi:hypothetical protein
MTADVRPAAVAGTFYPDDPESLRGLLNSLIDRKPQRCRIAIGPHAGYMYCGKTAGAVYGRLDVPSTAVLLCFHHRGVGSLFSIWPAGAWETPLGRAKIDEPLAASIQKAFPELASDRTAFLGEHSGEVHVPFLQFVRTDVKIVPISINAWPTRPGWERVKTLGEALARVPGIELVVASTDLNHYDDLATTRRKDQAAIDCMVRLDPEALAKTDVSMCGLAPVCTALHYALAIGAGPAQLIDHRTSAEVSGDCDEVVGYAGILIR